MNKTYEHTLENMMVDLAESPLGNIECDMEKEVGEKIDDKITLILSLVDKKNNLKVQDAIDDIEYFCKTRAYRCGFRRAMNIMLDSLCSE